MEYLLQVYFIASHLPDMVTVPVVTQFENNSPSEIIKRAVVKASWDLVAV